MQSAAKTVDDYLASLPEDRRAAVEALRKVILANLDPRLEEVMQYGMIGYVVPHKVYPPGYHCDPKQPLCFAALASQKQHLALYLMAAYGDPGERAWLEKAWRAAGKKLDMGKSCIRFRKLEDVPLEVVAEAFRRVPAEAFIASVEAALRKPREARPKAASTAPSKAAAGSAPAKARPAKAVPEQVTATKRAKAAPRKKAPAR